MLHFHHCLSFHTNNPSIFFFLTHTTTSVSSSSFEQWGLFKKNRRRIRLVAAVEKDSEFEIDPEKAREALRKLDDQLQTLSQKQIDPPKIRGNSILYLFKILFVTLHVWIGMFVLWWINGCFIFWGKNGEEIRRCGIECSPARSMDMNVCLVVNNCVFSFPFFFCSG